MLVTSAKLATCSACVHCFANIACRRLVFAWEVLVIHYSLASRLVSPCLRPCWGGGSCWLERILLCTGRVSQQPLVKAAVIGTVTL